MGEIYKDLHSPKEPLIFLDYKPVIVHTLNSHLQNFESHVVKRLTGVEGVVGVKGGFARELFKFSIGLTSTCNEEKLQDLDVVVFETPSEIRSQRIKRRDEIVFLSPYFESKDIEVCRTAPEGLIHFFTSRDVTMNELVLFREKDTLKFLYSQECVEDLTARIIRPSVHRAHTGLAAVWEVNKGTNLLTAATIGRCLYRKVKNDGDVFVSEQIDFNKSVQAMLAEDLYKIIKRFSDKPDLYKACMNLYQALGIKKDILTKVSDLVGEYTSKNKRIITSETVEDILDERQSEYSKWLENASDSQKNVAEVKFI